MGKCILDLPYRFTINEIKVLQHCKCSDLSRHSCEKALGLLCIVAYHECVIRLREDCFDSLPETHVRSCGWCPVLLVQPIRDIKFSFQVALSVFALGYTDGALSSLGWHRDIPCSTGWTDSSRCQNNRLWLLWAKRRTPFNSILSLPILLCIWTCWMNHISTLINEISCKMFAYLTYFAELCSEVVHGDDDST